MLFPLLVKWQKLEWLTGGPAGIDGVRYDDIPDWPILGELRGREGRAVFMYWLGVVVLVLAYLVCRGIVKSRVGRSLIAIRDNETAAAVMGVNRARTKTLVFGISAAMCAARRVAVRRSGATSSAPTSATFTLVGSITFVVIMVLGGAATLWGPIVGALALRDRRQPHPRGWGADSEGIVGMVFGLAERARRRRSSSPSSSSS